MCAYSLPSLSRGWRLSLVLQCKDFVQATKKLGIWKLPDLLIVHLKRFAYTQHNREKISTYVDFPLENLNMSDHCVNPDVSTASVLQLIRWRRMRRMRRRGLTVVVVAGEGCGLRLVCGVQPHGRAWRRPLHRYWHIFLTFAWWILTSSPIVVLCCIVYCSAYCRNLVDGKWYLHDDSSVSPVSTDRVKSSAAYVLFYRRRTPSTVASQYGAKAAVPDSAELNPSGVRSTVLGAAKPVDDAATADTVDAADDVAGGDAPAAAAAGPGTGGAAVSDVATGDDAL